MSVERAQPGRRITRVTPARADELSPGSAPPEHHLTRLTLPERPRLAPGVRLAGQMADSGYEDPPWLLEREGVGYVQVTELLYRLAEHCDGEHDHAAIASAVSRACGRTVSEENIRTLLREQFLRKGLIVSAEGLVVPARAGARSLLALRMRTRTVPRGIVERIAAPLAFLFAPPVLALVVIAAFLVQAWLLAVHGVAQAVHQTFYTSGLALAAVAALVLAAAFHEAGHAAALRYGGGRPGAMGVGLYLVYPAFYTDVSDNYRLPRWGRVRTDLGGFYFNLVFTLALAALYVVSGWEFLLIVILLIDFQILHQLLPFVRMDGYWTLVDLTGLPDFFTQVPNFLRSLLPSWLPGAAQEGPRLRWWARLILGGYLLLTLPLLAFLLFATVLAVPRVVGTVVDALAVHARELSDDVAAGDIAGMVLGPVQMALLVIPLIGVTLVLWGLARRLGRLVLRGWRGSAWQRAAATTAAGAIAAVLVFAWMPAWPRGGDAAPGTIAGLTSYRPIEPGERGALRDAPLFEREERAPSPGPSPSPTPSGTTTATATETPRSGASPTPSPAERTPARTATPAPATPTPPPPTPTPAATGGAASPTAAPASPTSAS